MINKDYMKDDEKLMDYNCPVCGYPIVLESDLEVCYNCGWFKHDEEKEDF